MKLSDATKKSFTQFLGFLLRDLSDSILTNLFNEVEDEDDDCCGFCGGYDDPEDLF